MVGYVPITWIFVKVHFCIVYGKLLFKNFGSCGVNPSLALRPGPPRLEVVVSVRVLSMGYIDLIGIMF